MKKWRKVDKKDKEKKKGSVGKGDRSSFFPHIVSKRLILQTCKNNGLFWKWLICCGLNKGLDVLLICSSACTYMFRNCASKYGSKGQPNKHAQISSNRTLQSVHSSSVSRGTSKKHSLTPNQKSTYFSLLFLHHKMTAINNTIKRITPPVNAPAKIAPYSSVEPVPLPANDGR